MSSVNNILRPTPAPKANALSSGRSLPSSNGSADFANILSPKTEKQELPADPKETKEKVSFQGKSINPNPDRSPRKISDTLEPKAPIKMNSTDPIAQKKINAENNNPIERAEPEEAVDNLGHRQALQRFLQKMKDQFGLDAEQIVGAFAQLTPQELEQPPELSLNKLLEALPLAPEQKEQARAIFEDMLKQTAATGMADYLTTSHRQLSLEVLSQAEAQKRAMDQSVEDMQSQFFPIAQKKVPTSQAIEKYQSKKDESKSEAAVLSQSALGQNAMALPVKSAPTKAPMAEATKQVSSSGSAQNVNEVMEQAELPMPPIETNSEDAGIDWKSLGMTEASKDEEFSVEPNQALEPKPASTKSGESNEISGKEQKIELPDFSLSTMAQEKPIQAHKLHEAQNAAALSKANSQQGPQVKNSTTTSASPIPSATVNLSAATPAMTKMGNDESASQEEDNSSGQSQDFSQVRGAHIGKNNTIGGSATDSFILNAKPNSTQEASNIKEVINQAQFLAKKGGGEMKVKLNPEGLGEVTMKVAVKSGQVSIEMTTQSNEAKKILEKGLGDLKANLMSHDLKIDQIKVDMPSDVSKHLARNHDDGQRQFAQQFMEQFRQDNNEWRRGFTDIPGARAYRSQREDARTGANERSGDENSKRASSRRLDLVA